METKKNQSVTDKVAVVKPAQGKNEKTVTATPKAEEKRAEQALPLSQLLEKQLTEIKRKKKLADRRDIFLRKSEELQECLSLLKQEQADGNFTTDNFSLTFAKKADYRNEEAFKISNPSLLTKFLEVLQSEISKAINSIESELLKDL